MLFITVSAVFNSLQEFASSGVELEWFGDHKPNILLNCKKNEKNRVSLGDEGHVERAD